MHIVGKICAWLVVIAAGAALGLTAKLLDVRGQWLDQAMKAKTANTTSEINLTKSRVARDAAKTDLSRELFRWERYWNEVPAAMVGEGADATLQADVGTAQKFGAAEGNAQPIVFAFQLAQDGSSAFVGPFQLVQAQANQSALKSAFRSHNAAALAGAQGKFRFRSMIPDADKARFFGLESQLLIAGERLRKEESNLAVQTQLVETAKQHRDFRLAELLGGDKVPEGLMSQIEKTEEERNAALAVVDSLRRQVSAAVHRLQELATQNKESARKLVGQELTPAEETASAIGRN